MVSLPNYLLERPPRYLAVNTPLAPGFLHATDFCFLLLLGLHNRLPLVTIAPEGHELFVPQLPG